MINLCNIITHGIFITSSLFSLHIGKLFFNSPTTLKRAQPFKWSHLCCSQYAVVPDVPGLVMVATLRHSMITLALPAIIGVALGANSSVFFLTATLKGLTVSHRASLLVTRASSVICQTMNAGFYMNWLLLMIIFILGEMSNYVRKLSFGKRSTFKYWC